MRHSRIGVFVSRTHSDSAASAAFSIELTAICGLRTSGMSGRYSAVSSASGA